MTTGKKPLILIVCAALRKLCPAKLEGRERGNLISVLTSDIELNEGMILKALEGSRKDKTIVLVFHRESTMNLADVVYEMENGRIS